jgi:hypothetical protein
MHQTRYFRASLLFGGLILAFASLWLFSAELFRPTIAPLPSNRESAERAAAHRNAALLAARVGWLRGDLWAEAAFTYANLEWSSSGNADAVLLQQAKANLTRAVSLLPADSSVWLLLGGLASRYHWQSPNAIEALKMSYYTGPEERDLIPLRITLSARLDVGADPELDRLFRQELETVFKSEPNFRAGVVTAYRGGTPQGRLLIEDVAQRYDQSLAQSLLGGAVH